MWSGRAAFAAEDREHTTRISAAALNIAQGHPECIQDSASWLKAANVEETEGDCPQPSAPLQEKSKRPTGASAWAPASVDRHPRSLTAMHQCANQQSHEEHRRRKNLARRREGGKNYGAALRQHLGNGIPSALGSHPCVYMGHLPTPGYTFR